MARSTIRVTGDLIEWVRPDQSIEFAFDVNDVHPDLLTAVRNYGIKQILADAGAVGRNVPDEERIGKMDKRARALRDGTWNYRDGHGTPKEETLRDAQYRALVAVGAFPDSPESIQAWRDAKPAERAAVFAQFPDAAQHMPKAPAAVGESLIAKLRAMA